MHESSLTPATPPRLFAVDDKIEASHSMTTRTGSRVHPNYKTKRKVTSLPEYSEALRIRGDITIWFSNEAVQGWRATPTGKGGAQPKVTTGSPRYPSRSRGE